MLKYFGIMKEPQPGKLEMTKPFLAILELGSLNNLLTNVQRHSATAVTSKRPKAYALNATATILCATLMALVSNGELHGSSSILQEELTAIDTDEVFEESIRQCYQRRLLLAG